MSKSENIALVDMDGTLCDFSKAMDEALDALSSPGEQIDGSADWYKARRRLIKNQPNFWRDLEALPVGVRILRLLLEMDFGVHILTKGPSGTPNAWTEKVQWCRDRLPRAVKITITEDKGLVYGKVLVDDWPPYIDRWLEWRPRGVVIMPAQPWNSGYDHPRVVRVTEDDVGMLPDLLRKIRDREPGEDIGELS